MVTYRMIGCADENGRTYESYFGTYSKEDGFILSKDAERMSRSFLLDKLLHEDCWTIQQEIKKMTKEDIEAALGYQIEIISNTEETKTSSKLLDDFYRFWS